MDVQYERNPLEQWEGEGGAVAPPSRGYEFAKEEAESKSAEGSLMEQKASRNECLRMLDQCTLKALVADRAYIKTHPTRDYLGSELISVPSTKCLQEVVQLLSKHRISCVPVIAPSDDPDSPGIFQGFVDFLDIVTFIASKAPSGEAGTLESMGKTIMNSTAQSLIDLSHKDTMHPLFEGSPVSSAVELFAKGVHRVPIFDAKKTIVGLCSQFDVIRYFSNQFQAGQASGMASRSLKSYGAGEMKLRAWTPEASHVLSVLPSATVSYCIAKMAMAGVETLAIVDPNQRFLVGSFSAHDIGRAFYAEPQRVMSWFNMPVERFLEAYSAEILKPLFELSTLSLGSACKLLCEAHAHHLWIVDDLETMMPIGVVTLTDICRIVQTFKWPTWRKKEAGAGAGGFGRPVNYNPSDYDVWQGHEELARPWRT